MQTHLAIIMALALGATDGLRVYDCEAERTTYEVVDLLATQECPHREGKYAKPREQQVQVLHSEGRNRVEGIRCRVVLTRTASTCGKGLMHHIYGTMTTTWRDPILVSALQCQDMMAKGTYMVPGKKPHKLVFEIGVPASGTFFTHGGTDGHGWVVCDSFRSGGTYIHYGYEQTMVELLVDHVTGFRDVSGETVEFLGVKEVAAKGTLKDSVVGRVIWDPKAGIKCEAQVSEVYSGPGEIHPLKDSPDKNL